jgi:colanic acid/amylovoran biosynthesis protein
MKIIITNVYSFRNRGDSAIVEAMAQYFKTRVPAAEIYMSSSFYRENQGYYGKLGCHSVPPLWEIPMHTNKLIRLGLAGAGLLKLFFSGLPGFCRRVRSPVLDLYREADLIIDAGGGSFFSSNRYFFYLGFYQHLFSLWAGKWMKCPVMIAPQSMGPFNKKMDVLFFKQLMHRLDCVMVREKISEKLMDELNVPAVLVPDCAFMNNFSGEPSSTCLRSLEAVDAERTNIGMTVLDWSWAIAGGDGAAYTRYLHTLAESLAAVARIRDITVHLFSQTDVSTEKSDHQVAAELSLLLQEQGLPCIVHDPGNTASGLCRLYAQMDLFIGSRMHSCIFAVTQAVPVVALAYQPKTRGVLSWVSDDLAVLPINTFTAEELTDAVMRSLENRKALSEQLAVRCRELSAAVLREFDALILPVLIKSNENHSGS